MAQDSRKSELIGELARARRDISGNARGLRRDLDIASRIKATFQRHAIAWLSGAGLLAFILARLPARRGKVPMKLGGRKSATEEKVVKAGILVTVLKIAFDLARPFLTKWVARRVATYADQRFGMRR